MPEKTTIQKARKDLREGKSPSTAAGEFVHEEIEHVREGKHGARSARQAIAIGLSRARRAGIPLKPPAAGKTSRTIRSKAKADYKTGQASPKISAEGTTKRGRASLKALKKEPTNTTSHAALSRHAKSVARSKQR
jgi:hypothetical protein